MKPANKTTLTAIACVVLLLIVGMWLTSCGLPSLSEIKEVQPTKLSRVLAADGSEIGCYPPEGMIVLAEADIPEMAKHAFISAEDSSFYTHQGLDFKRIAGAMLFDLRKGGFEQGASTITQQVVRSYFLSSEKTIGRKIREALLARRIEKNLTKEQILTLYLNRVYLGSGAYGIEAASLRYFGKSCRELGLAEIAMLAGLAPAPAAYSPLNDFEAAKTRQRYVLGRMTQDKYITKEQADQAYAMPLRIQGRSGSKFSEHPYVTDYVEEQIKDKLGDSALEKGLTIQTTIDARMQRRAEFAMRKGLIELEMRQGKYYGPVRGLSERQKTALLSLQRNQFSWKGSKAYELYWGKIVSLNPLKADMGDQIREIGCKWVAPRGGWNPSSQLRDGDMVRVAFTNEGLIISQEPKVQGALVAFDVKTGRVLSMVGGFDYSGSQFNRAVNAKRQCGSAIKPFIYAAAIDKGMTPASVIYDMPISYKADGDELWQPKNNENRFYGRTTLREGLVKSRNVVTVKIVEDIGIGYTIDYLKNCGLGSKLPRDLTLSLGSNVITPWELAKAYAVFPSYGRRFDPFLIDSVNQTGRGVVFGAAGGGPGSEMVIPQQTAFMLVNIMQDVVSYGTGSRARALGRPVAGKTGTSNDNRDAWFIGFTPDILCAVWVGSDDMQPLGRGETGGHSATPIFVDFMQEALGGKPANDFAVPNGIVFAKVDSDTGKLAADGTENTRFEVFREGALPPESDPVQDTEMMKEVF